MENHNSIIIDWFGTYTLDEISEDRDNGFGLYLATGKLKYERDASIQYCGITKGGFYNRLRGHHKAHKINREQEFWLGKLIYPNRTSRHFLEIAESIIIYFWQPTLNEKKRFSLPKPTTLINRWFKTDGSPRYRQHSLCKDLQDVISWDGKLWRTGNLQVWEE
ncbi:MAG: hypothetical protein HQK72_05785 [Desulfamplus sp.]|nr:hypothetical protein [Desulfamplus sp.]